MALFYWLAGAGRTTSVVLPEEQIISPEMGHSCHIFNLHGKHPMVCFYLEVRIEAFKRQIPLPRPFFPFFVEHAAWTFNNILPTKMQN